MTSESPSRTILCCSRTRPSTLQATARSWWK
ncbi:hypothetical protein LEMLEM_LOCUS19605 [Lemmus lemmus]